MGILQDVKTTPSVNLFQESEVPNVVFQGCQKYSKLLSIAIQFTNLPQKIFIYINFVYQHVKKWYNQLKDKQPNITVYILL